MCVRRRRLVRRRRRGSAGDGRERRGRALGRVPLGCAAEARVQQDRWLGRLCGLAACAGRHSRGKGSRMAMPVEGRGGTRGRCDPVDGRVGMVCCRVTRAAEAQSRVVGEGERGREESEAAERAFAARQLEPSPRRLRRKPASPSPGSLVLHGSSFRREPVLASSSSRTPAHPTSAPPPFPPSPRHDLPPPPRPRLFPIARSPPALASTTSDTPTEVHPRPFGTHTRLGRGPRARGGDDEADCGERGGELELCAEAHDGGGQDRGGQQSTGQLSRGIAARERPPQEEPAASTEHLLSLSPLDPPADPPSPSPAATMSLVVPEAHVQFQHILRLLNTNVDGKRKIMVRPPPSPPTPPRRERPRASELTPRSLRAVRPDRDQGCRSPLRQPRLQEGRRRPDQAVRSPPSPSRRTRWGPLVPCTLTDSTPPSPYPPSFTLLDRRAPPCSTLTVPTTSRLSTPTSLSSSTPPGATSSTAPVSSTRTSLSASSRSCRTRDSSRSRTGSSTGRRTSSTASTATSCRTSLTRRCARTSSASRRCPIFCARRCRSRAEPVADALLPHLLPCSLPDPQPPRSPHLLGPPCSVRPPFPPVECAVQDTKTTASSARTPSLTLSFTPSLPLSTPAAASTRRRPAAAARPLVSGAQGLLSSSQEPNLTFLPSLSSLLFPPSPFAPTARRSNRLFATCWHSAARGSGWTAGTGLQRRAAAFGHESCALSFSQ